MRSKTKPGIDGAGKVVLIELARGAETTEATPPSGKAVSEREKHLRHGMTGEYESHDGRR